MFKSEDAQVTSLTTSTPPAFAYMKPVHRFDPGNMMNVQHAPWCYGDTAEDTTCPQQCDHVVDQFRHCGWGMDNIARTVLRSAMPLHQE